MTITLELVNAWQQAVNQREIEQVLRLSHPKIQIAGPKGAVTGHQALQQWFDRARLILKPKRLYNRNHDVVIEQHAIWYTLDGNEIIGEAEVASHYQTDGRTVTHYTRYEDLNTALQNASLSHVDEVPFPS